MVIEAKDTHKLFVFGTLMYPEVRNTIIKSDYIWEEALVANYSVREIPNAHFPACVSDKKFHAYGHLLSGLSNEDMERLDAYEGVPTLYTRIIVDVILADKVHTTAWMYLYMGEPAKEFWFPDPRRLKDGHDVRNNTGRRICRISLHP